MEDSVSTERLPLWKKVLFSGILAVLVLGSLEVAAQLYLRTAKGYAGESFLQYEFDPYKNIHPVRDWVDTRGVRHNSQGFRRDGDVSRQKPPETLRIFLMGASTAYGTGGLWPHIQREFEVLDNSETIDAFLERMLSDRLTYDSVEVINAAIPSVWTHHHLIYLNQTILGYDPDLILFLDGLNDHFYYDPSHDQFARYAYTEASHVIMGPPTFYAWVRMNAWWLFRKSAFAHVAIRAGQGLMTVIRGQPELRPIEVEQALGNLEWVFERNALAMIERNALLLQHEGVPAIFMLQPMLILERERLGAMPAVEQELFAFNVDATEPNYEAYIRRATPIVARKVRETVEPLGGTFLDLTEIYEGASEQIFTDYAHLTPLGNRILAERIADTVVALFENRPTEQDASRRHSN